MLLDVQIRVADSVADTFAHMSVRTLIDLAGQHVAVSFKPSIANLLMKHLAAIVDALTPAQGIVGATHLQRSELAEAQALVDEASLDNYDSLLKVTLEYSAHVRPHIPPDFVEAAWVTLPSTSIPIQPAAGTTANDVAATGQVEKESKTESKKSEKKEKEKFARKGAKDKDNKDAATPPPEKKAKAVADMLMAKKTEETAASSSGASASAIVGGGQLKIEFALLFTNVAKIMTFVKRSVKIEKFEDDDIKAFKVVAKRCTQVL